MDIQRIIEKWKSFWIVKSMVHLNIIVYDLMETIYIFQMST